MNKEEEYTGPFPEVKKSKDLLNKMEKIECKIKEYEEVLLKFPNEWLQGKINKLKGRYESYEYKLENLLNCR